MEDHQVDIGAVDSEIEQYEYEGKTAMLIAIDQVFKGSIAVLDTVKDTAKEAIKEMHDQGLEVIMLTGDNQRTAGAIAREVGIDDVIAEVLPDQKADKIKSIQDTGKVVAMVGDGVNDAPALALADVGIAMGTGTEVAIEAADLTILGDDLTLIPRAINLSHETIKISNRTYSGPLPITRLVSQSQPLVS